MIRLLWQWFLSSLVAVSVLLRLCEAVVAQGDEVAESGKTKLGEFSGQALVSEDSTVALVFRDDDKVFEIKLSPSVEGKLRKVRIPFLSQRSFDLSDLKAKSSCGCVSAVVECDGDRMGGWIELTINPGYSDIAQGVDLYSDSVRELFGRLLIRSECRQKLKLDSTDVVVSTEGLALLGGWLSATQS